MRNPVLLSLASTFITAGYFTCINSCDAFLQNPPKGFAILKTPYYPLNTNAQTNCNPLPPTATTIVLNAAAKRRGAMSRKNKDDNAATTSEGSGVDDDAATPLPETSSTIQTTKSSSSSSSPVGRVYSRPELYDLAVGYRDYEEEVQFLLNAHAKYSLKSGIGGDGGNDGPLNILELAAGPARHCVTALKYFGSDVNTCTAVDTSDDMVNYSNIEIADEELGKKGGDLRDRFNYINSDMRTIGLETPDTQLSPLQAKSFDCAWILLGSLQHLTTNDDVISCFKSTANLLYDGGTMIIELPHPKETFAMGECTRNGWEVPLQGEDGEQYGELKIIWGDDDDVFDPIRQVRGFTVVMDLVETTTGGKKEKKSDIPAIREVVPTRLFTAQEIDALGRIGGFELAHMYGALEEEEIDINNEEEAFRLICVMRKLSRA